jgi:DNA adenine methylase
MNLKPLFKWAGSKYSEIPSFCNFFPENFDKYIEPFVGGGSVFFHINKPNSIICDNNVELINFYKQLANGNAEKIAKLCESFGENEDDYYRMRDDYVATNDLDRAAKYFYILKTCYRGMTRYNKKGKFNIPWGRYKNVNFREIISDEHEKLLKSTTIISGNYSQAMEHATENSFAFFDPPYDSEFKNYFLPFGKEEHIKLADDFKNSKCCSMMVIAKTEFINSLYKDYIIHEYDKSYRFRITKKRVAKEQLEVKHLVIVNSVLKQKLKTVPSFFENC